MTELSRPFQDGVGDGGPYDADQWDDILEAVGQAWGANVGVIPGYLNELAVTSPSDNTLRINTGAAQNEGTWYKNDASKDLTSSSPAVGTTGRRVVLRKDWTTRTVRLAIISEADGTATLPALTQTDGVTWEIPLESFTITTAGVIGALTDEREWAGFQPGLHSLSKLSAARWVLPGWSIGALVAGRTPTADAIEFVPFLIRRSTTFDRIGLNVSTLQAGQVARLGIYRADVASDGLVPAGLLLDAGTVSVATTGDKEATISHTLEPGWYFTALVDEAASPPAYSGIATTSLNLPVTVDSPSFGVTKGVALRTAANAGADWPNNGLPSVAPAVTTRIDIDALVLVQLREAA